MSDKKNQNFVEKLSRATLYLVILIASVLLLGLYYGKSINENNAIKLEEKLTLDVKEEELDAKESGEGYYDIDNEESMEKKVLDNSKKIALFEEKIEAFEQKFEKFYFSTKLQQALISYIKLRDKIFAGKDLKLYIRDFRVLIQENSELKEKFDKMEPLLVDLKTFDEINEGLNSVITDVMALKKHDPKSGFIEKVRYSFARTVSVRKIDGMGDSIDGSLYRIQEYLGSHNCVKLSEEFAKIDKKYKEKLATVEADINKACNVLTIDSEIIDIFEYLSS